MRIQFTRPYKTESQVHHAPCTWVNTSQESIPCVLIMKWKIESVVSNKINKYFPLKIRAPFKPFYTKNKTKGEKKMKIKKWTLQSFKVRFSVHHSQIDGKNKKKRHGEKWIALNFKIVELPNTNRYIYRYESYNWSLK